MKSGKLESFVARLLRSYGAKPLQAKITVEAMVAADARDHPTHGVSRLPFLVNGIKHKNCVPRAEPKIAKSHGAVAVLDGRKGLGHYVGFRAMSEAVKRAKRFGIGAVAVKNSNHFGSAAFYAEIASKQNCVGLVFCNAEAIVPAFEGRKKVFGTNPIAASFPSMKTTLNPQGFLTLDLATSSVTRGLLLESARRGVALPIGFVADSRGVPTTDAKKALDGLILPLGGLTKGYKGFALALMVDVLSSGLSGAATAMRVRGSTTTADACTKGDFYLAINVSAFRALPAFKREIARLAFDVKKSGGRALYPGEKELRAEHERRKRGVPLDANLIEKLEALGAERGLKTGF